MTYSSTKLPINLLRGWPNTSLLPVSLIQSAANAALSDPSVAHPGLLYGPDEGYASAREAMANWLTDFYRPPSPTTSERICITGGASQNLGCLLSVYTDPGYTSTIWIAAPAYYLAFRVFQDAGFAERMRAVPEDEGGVDVKVLRQELEKSEKKRRKEEKEGHESGSTWYKLHRSYAKVYRHVIYCVPTFSNPSSRTMPLERRQDLVRLAREYDALIICDDVYDFLQWPADTNYKLSQDHATLATATATAHLPRIVDIDRTLDGGAERSSADGFGNAVSNGSFSKLAGPGLRCGWAEGTAKLAHGVSQTGTTCSGGAPSQLTSTYLTRMLETGGLQAHIRDVLRPAYASRYATLMREIERCLVPLGFATPQPGRQIVGGFFVWLGVPDAFTAAELTRRCQEEENLVIGPGKIFEIPNEVPGGEGVSFGQNVRLCLAWVEEGELAEGVERLGRVARAMLEERERGEYVVVERERDVGDFGVFK
ncbi:hypothetical protein MBLNU230_g7385t1 [Neophaeotheca triangularis]